MVEYQRREFHRRIPRLPTLFDGHMMSYGHWSSGSYLRVPKKTTTSRSNYDHLLFDAKLAIFKWGLSNGSRIWKILSMNMRELNYQVYPSWNWFSSGPKHHQMINKRSPWVCIIKSPLWICTRNIAIHQGSPCQKWMLLLKNYLSRLQSMRLVIAVMICPTLADDGNQI